MDVSFFLFISIPLLTGCILDALLGDPRWLPHPVVGFGKLIAWGEKKLNRGKNRTSKGALLALSLIITCFAVTFMLAWYLYTLNLYAAMAFGIIIVFFCLAARTLIVEVRNVFRAVDKSLDEGRKQVARIVGRDTSQLSEQQIRTAALETLAENLSDGVIAPLFWYMLLGLPGMLTYKMVNTLDSMIGYKNDRYKAFGRWAARIDDAANYIPARLTAVLMIIANGRFSLFSFVKKYGRKHASPNSGYPEAALAGVLNCRFGGPNVYFGNRVDKPYIGNNLRELTYSDVQKAVKINIISELLMLILAAAVIFGLSYIV